MSTSEQQDGYDTDGCPQVSVLNHWQYIGVCHSSESDKAKDSCNRNYDARIVDGSEKRRMRTASEVAADPIVDLLS